MILFTTHSLCDILSQYFLNGRQGERNILLKGLDQNSARMRGHMQFEKITMNLLLCLYATYVHVMEKKDQQHSFGGG